MSLLGWAIGAVILGTALHSDHSDHSDYDNYGDYSDYSDAAEKRERKRKELLSTIESQRNIVNNYKETDINKHLASTSLKKETGDTVSVSKVCDDGFLKIDKEAETETKQKCNKIKEDISQIDSLVNKIDNILKEGE